MKITNETELMYNQKASLKATPDKQFEALQTFEGNSLLFSIGIDGIFFITREVPGNTHGWVRIDLSSSLSASCYNGALVVAKTFDIAQDNTFVNSDDFTTSSIDIALVVTVNGVDHLHIITAFENTLNNWTTNAPVFDQTTQYNFDYPGNDITTYLKMPINDVQILDTNDGSGMQYIIADLITGSNTQLISRYYIDVLKQREYAWVPHNLQANIDAGKVTSCLGCGPYDGPNNDYNVGGMYVLGAEGYTGQLLYTPSYNFLHPEEHAESTIFDLPSGYDPTFMAMALSIPGSAAPYSDLFFVSNYKDSNGVLQGGLYFLPNAKQISNENSDSKPQLIYTHELLMNIQSIHIKNWNDNIVLWGQSEYSDTSTTPAITSSRLFIMEGVAGREANADAWSVPIPLLLNVENSSAYVNNSYSLDNSVDSDSGNAYGSCNVLFAHQSDGELVQLFQDPVTSAWQERHILTVPNGYTDMYENETYTTHINLTDDNHISQPGITAYIWSSSPTSVYVNNVYTTLAFDKAYKATADTLGIINVTQPVSSIGGISYFVAVQDPDSTSPTYQQWSTAVINPIAVTNANLAKQVPDGNNNYMASPVPDERGVPQQLAKPADQFPTSQKIYALLQNNKDKSINQDGLTADQRWPDPATAITALSSVALPRTGASVESGKRRVQHVKKFARPDRQAKHMRFDHTKNKIWGCTFGKNGKHYEGVEAMKEMGLVVNADGTLALKLANGNLVGSSNWLEAKAGHLFKWAKSEAKKLESFVIQTAEEGLDCLMTIAGSVYHFVVKCMNDIANAIHTALNAIETAFENLISWIGSLFAWGDIKRTHQVLKTMFTTYANNCIRNISTIQDQLNYGASLAINDINTWAGLVNDTFPSDSTSSYSSQNANTDQTKGQHSPSSNWGHQQASNNTSSSTSSSPVGDFGDLLTDFLNSLDVEINIIIHAVDQMKEVISKITSQPLGTTIKQIVAILADAVIESSVNVTDTLLTAAGQLLTDLVDSTLAAPIQIPVLSNLYKTFIGDELTIIDLVCLIAAIPVNIIYKLANDKQAPFPDNASTTALINASNFSEFISAAANIQQPTVSAAVSLRDDASEDWEKFTGWVKNHWSLIGNSCALFGAIGVSVFGVAKTVYPDSYFFATLYTGFYLPYIGPDIIGAITSAGKPGQFWYNYLNVGIAGLAFIKAGVDIYSVTEYKNLNPAPAPVAVSSSKKVLVGNDDPPVNPPADPPVNPAPVPDVPPPAIGADPGATSGWRRPFEDANGNKIKDKDGNVVKPWADISPIVDAIINLLWYTPVIAAFMEAKKNNFDSDYGSYKSNVLQCTGNSMFNFGGIIAPVPSFAPYPYKEIAMGVQVVMNLGYGAMSLASTWE